MKVTTAQTNSNHAFVIDGYRMGQKGMEVHINWGWGGKDDGFYPLKAGIVLYETILDQQKRTVKKEGTLYTGLDLFFGISPCLDQTCNDFKTYELTYDQTNGRVEASLGEPVKKI